MNPHVNSYNAHTAAALRLINTVSAWRFIQAVVSIDLFSTPETDEIAHEADLMSIFSALQSRSVYETHLGLSILFLP